MKTLFFDCDGVLVDSESLAEAVLAERIEEWFPDLRLDTVLRELPGMTTGDSLRYLETLSSHSLPHNATNLVEKAIDARLKHELRAIEGVAEVISRLTLPMAIVSNSSWRRVKNSLATTGLDTWLNRVPVFSAQQVQHPKPDPSIYRLAARALSRRPADCLVVEDSVSGVTAAYAAGMTVIGFIGASHVPDQSAHSKKLALAGAWRTISAMKDLESLVAEWCDNHSSLHYESHQHGSRSSRP